MSSAPAALAALVGTELGPTAWRTVDQETIGLHAQVSGDRQWIHVDVERAARESPFGRTIAHGTLTLAMIDGFRDELGGLAVPGVALGVNLGYDRVRFPAPVPAGTRVRARCANTALAPARDGWWRLTQRFTVEAEDGARPVCVADCVLGLRPATT